MMCCWVPLILMVKRRQVGRVILFLLLTLLLSTQSKPISSERISEPVLIDGHSIREIGLSGPAASAWVEFSGMDWCGEQLILVPQYPEKFGDGASGALFSIPAADIANYLSDENPADIVPARVTFVDQQVQKMIPGFDGFEAIAFAGDIFFMLVEARLGKTTHSYIVKGEVEDGCSSLVLQADTLRAIPSQSGIANLSDETMIVIGDMVVTIHEANGAAVNPEPVAHAFDLNLDPLPALSMPSIVYRITDATQPDSEGAFWVMNYFFPGDAGLRVAEDPLMGIYGTDETHVLEAQVERLVALAVTTDGIILRDEPPVYLILDGDVARNWEGIARFGSGFLIVTDRHPDTILAFLSLSD